MKKLLQIFQTVSRYIWLQLIAVCVICFGVSQVTAASLQAVNGSGRMAEAVSSPTQSEEPSSEESHALSENTETQHEPSTDWPEGGFGEWNTSSGSTVGSTPSTQYSKPSSQTSRPASQPAQSSAPASQPVTPPPVSSQPVTPPDPSAPVVSDDPTSVPESSVAPGPDVSFVESSPSSEPTTSTISPENPPESSSVKPGDNTEGEWTDPDSPTPGESTIPVPDPNFGSSES